MKLNELAATISANIIRTGFNPTTEQTTFVVVINGESFNFSCGLMACIPKEKRVSTGYGSKVINPLLRLENHLQASSHYSNAWSIYKKIRQCRVKAINNLKSPEVMDVFKQISMLAEPTLAEVLYCIRLDSDACNMSFDDWCGNYGYNNDSISALNTYNACIENGKKLRKALGNDLFKQVLTAEEE